MLRIDDRIEIPLRELELSFARSGGPGGQNVNKVSSKVTLRWDVRHSPSLPGDVRVRFLQRHSNRISADGVLVLQSQRHREQQRNVEDCKARLAEMLREVARPPRERRPTRPTRSSVRRRLEDKRRASRRKRDRRPPRDDD